MTEYISREAAIKRFTFATLDCLGMEPIICASDVVLALQSIPAADVRPVVRGKWNIVKLPPDTGYKAKECSACKCNFWDLKEWNFCPNCGARMEES